MTALEQLASALASLRDFAHSALNGTAHQESLDHYDRLATAALERYQAERVRSPTAVVGHAQEPWCASAKLPHLVSDACGDAVAEFDGSVDGLPRSRDVENARRAVACVNYCRGIPTARLEQLNRSNSPAYTVDTVSPERRTAHA